MEAAEGQIELDPKYSDLYLNPPPHKVTILTGGRGSGKSTVVSHFLNLLTFQSGHVILFTRYTMRAAEISIIPEFTAMMDKLGNRHHFDVTSDEIENKVTGSRILFRGIKTSSGNQTANLKSIPGLTTFVIDEGEEFLDEDAFNTISLSIRSMLHPNRVVWVQNPSHKKHFIYKRFIQGGEPCTHIHTTYLDNEENLSAEFIADAERMKATNYKRYCHVFLGEWLDDAEGLLWDMDIINLTRVSQAPEHMRTFVAVDPAVTANEKSDETGILVVGTHNGKGYVLEDLSGRYSPNEWAGKAVEAYRRWGCAEIVCEVNQGGDMVEGTIKNLDPTIRVVSVRATKGKYVRAEPVYALYQRGLIHHVGYHSKLEAQMVSFNPDQQQASPDRLDALVWGFTHAMVNQIQGQARVYTGPGIRKPKYI
jgi:PBSX family phage terminase large subunit